MGDRNASSMDVYALGSTLYNMLTKTPVNSKKLIELMNTMTSNPGSGRTASDLKSTWNSLNPDFVRISKLEPSVPVLMKMLDKDSYCRVTDGNGALLYQNF